MATARVIFTSKLPSALPSRQGQISTLLAYTVDDAPPDNMVIESADPSDDDISAAIAKNVLRKKELAGKTFEV